jgi:hypothetical protein
VSKLEAIVVARVVDVLEKSFVGQDGKDVKYTQVSVIDEDAFMDSDRVFIFKVSPDSVKGLDLVGNYWKFKGVLTKDKGFVKFKGKEILEVK